MIVDRDGGRSPGELRGEKAVGRVEAPLIHLGPWEPRRLRRREGRRLATEAPAFLAPVVAEVVVERVDVAPALLPEEVDVVEVVSIGNMDEVAAASLAHLEEPQVRQDVAVVFYRDAPASPEVQHGALVAIVEALVELEPRRDAP